MGVEPNLISDTLRCSMAQRLVRRICTFCKASYTPSEKLLDEFGISLNNTMKFVEGKGCSACHFTGFRGRFPIVELWVPTREELLLINRRPDNLSLRNIVFSVPGRTTMIDSGFRRVLAGETTLEELMRTVPYDQIEAGRESIAKIMSILV
jgi:type II secretory ATPase GspE/PulE/Tfp pilus assembly ATPase PilB-like protein